MIFPGVSISISCMRVSKSIPFCISILFGSPTFAPMGTIGAVALGVPVCLATGGSAAIIIVGIPDCSIALCTKTAERWQVPQPPVITTPSTFSSLSIFAISGPIFSLNTSTSPPPPIKPI